MSEAVQKVCPECGKVFEDSTTHHNRKTCSRACASRRGGKNNHWAQLAAQRLAEREARDAAKRRRDQMLKRRDAEFAKLGVRVVVSQGEGGARVERRGMVGGGCCAMSSAAFNPRPFDLRVFKP